MAVKCYKLAADQGYAKAQVTLGDCYSLGMCVKRDDAAGFEWYKLAADNGYAEAQAILGDCYRNGGVVEKNAATAAKWFKLAADQGHFIALYELGRCYMRGYGVDQNAAMAVKWYKLAADRGHQEAQHILGRCYSHGIGTRQDYDKAIKYYRLAAEDNYSTSKEALAFLVDQLNLTQHHQQSLLADYHHMMVEGEMNAIANKFCNAVSQDGQRALVSGMIFDYERSGESRKLRKKLDALFAVILKQRFPIDLLQQLYVTRALLFKPELGNQDSLNTFFTDLSEIDVAYLATDKIIPFSSVILDAWALASQSEDIEEVQHCAKELSADLIKLLHLAKGKDIMMPDSLFSGMGDILVKAHLGTSYSIAINSLDENKLLLLATMFETQQGKPASQMMQAINQFMGAEVVVNPQMQKESLLRSASLFADQGEKEVTDELDNVRKLKYS